VIKPGRSRLPTIEVAGSTGGLAGKLLQTLTDVFFKPAFWALSAAVAQPMLARTPLPDPLSLNVATAGLPNHACFASR